MSRITRRGGSGWDFRKGCEGTSSLFGIRRTGAENGGGDELGSGADLRAMPALLAGGFGLGVLSRGVCYGPELRMGLLDLGKDRRSHAEKDKAKRERQDDRPAASIVGNVKNSQVHVF